MIRGAERNRRLNLEGAVTIAATRPLGLRCPRQRSGSRRTPVSPHQFPASPHGTADSPGFAFLLPTLSRRRTLVHSDDRSALTIRRSNTF